jgi:predicted dehydrogenase
MRGLIVGFGSIGRRHARNWVSLEAGPLAVAHHAGWRQTPREPSPVPEVTEYDDLDEALARERPEVVLVTNPTSLHVDATRRALAAGAHVLVEKPLGHRLTGVGELLDDAAKASRRLAVAYNLRFHPGLARLKAMLQERIIGRVIYARAEVGEYLPDWHPWEDYRGGYAARRDLGGGVVLTMSHELDAMCWLFGAPRRLSALTTRSGVLEVDVEDVADITLEFESELVGSVHLDYLRRPPTRSIEVLGERGLLRWEYHANRLLQYRPDTQRWQVEEGDPRFERNQMYLEELRHFLACVRADAERECRLPDGEQGAAVLAIALAALRSSDEGRAIDFRTEDTETRSWLSGLNGAT